MPMCALNRPTVGRILLLSQTVLLGGLLSTSAPITAHAVTANDAGAESSEADEHLVRRCENRAKYEYCYWAKAGSHRASAR